MATLVLIVPGRKLALRFLLGSAGIGSKSMRAAESRPFLPRTLAIVSIAVMGVFVAFPALAETRVDLGKQSKETVKDACDKVGGFNVEGDGGKGYGCYNPKNGVLVACDNTSSCMGFIPRGRPRGATVGGALGTGLPPVIGESLSSAGSDSGTAEGGGTAAPPETPFLQ
jgi:hypothetical protein